MNRAWMDPQDICCWDINLEIIVNKGNHPQMAQEFRLVKYYNLPRSMRPAFP